MGVVLAIVCSLIGIFFGMICYAGSQSLICSFLGAAFAAWCVYWFALREPHDLRGWEDDD